MKLERSRKLYEEAVKALVGGVDSPVRSFKAVDTGIIFAERASGPYIWDADGNKYIDYVMSWGVSILGHAYKPVNDAAVAAIKNGSSFGLATENEIRLADIIKKHFRSIDKVRLVTSGTEACMSAVRLARAYTNKQKIIKFDGCYHGHFDSLLVKSGSGNLTFGIPSGKGILPVYTRDTVSLPFNDTELLKDAIHKNRQDIACIILEPVPCNAGVILPREGFLKEVAGIACKEKIVLIFDEVITGFRLSLGGAQGLFGIRPDLTCLGKIIGGGFPVGAVGGRKEIMDLLAPEGPVYQAGTLAGNPVSVAAGIKALECLEADKSIYRDLEKKTKALVLQVKQELKAQGIPATVNTIGSLFSIVFDDAALYRELFSGLCKEGILFPPSAFETCFVSRAHDDKPLLKTVLALKRAIKRLHWEPGLKLSTK